MTSSSFIPSSPKKKGLGRGLSALMESTTSEKVSEPGVEATDKTSEDRIALDQIHPSPYQPRKTFDEGAIDELATSIREKGVLQPILVRKKGEGQFELIAGERRLRASKRAGLTHIPCRILDLSDQESLEIGLLENVQRQDLSCLEEAQGYWRLMEEFKYTQDQLAQKIGKSRSHIANTLRLLSLPADVRVLLDQHHLTPGHGRALLGAPDPSVLARYVVERKLNVRQTEVLVKRGIPQRSSKEGGFDSIAESGGEEQILAHQLMEMTGLKVDINIKPSGGAIHFVFKTPEEIDRFLSKLTRGYQEERTISQEHHYDA